MMKMIICGVPQDSMLSIVLLLLYTSDITFISNVVCRYYNCIFEWRNDNKPIRVIHTNQYHSYRKGVFRIDWVLFTLWFVSLRYTVILLAAIAIPSCCIVLHCVVLHYVLYDVLGRHLQRMRGKTIPLFAGTDLSTAFFEVETVITRVTQVAVLTSPACLTEPDVQDKRGLVFDYIWFHIPGSG